MKKTVFLSYSSSQEEAARRIELSLKAEGHSVFRDRSALPPGESFDARIRSAIAHCDLFIFLISRESLSKGRYTLTELKFAEQKWEHPKGYVLPVLVDEVPTEDIPSYLSAVTFLIPKGNLAAEVAAEVDRNFLPWWRWFLKPQGLALSVLVGLLVAGGIAQGIIWYSDYRERIRQSTELLKQGQLQASSGNFANAWNLLEKADSIHPDCSEVIDAQERLAMTWLDKARSSQLDGSLKVIADRVSTVLTRGATTGKNERAADLQAHLGWGDFLRAREGAGGLDPLQSYRRATEIDPNNVYAHTMWGFEILRSGGSLVEAQSHFLIALNSKREREYVRHMQISALLWPGKPELESEAIRVANEMRSQGESMAAVTPEDSEAWRLWNIYYSRLVLGQGKSEFLAALKPEDHVATFRWLFPENRLPESKTHLYLYILAQLHENNEDRDTALDIYRQLQSRLGDSPGSLLDGVHAAIRRLSTQPKQDKQSGSSLRLIFEDPPGGPQMVLSDTVLGLALNRSAV